MLRNALVFLALPSLGALALGSSSQDVCLPGVATSGCSQLQVSSKVPSFQLVRDTVPLVKAEKASVPNALVEVEGGLSVQSGAQLAETFLQGAHHVELALATLQDSMTPTTQELSTKIGQLVEDQGASPVGCKSRLQQADIKLKEIIETISSTASILQTTKKEVQVIDTQLKQTLVSIKAVDADKTKDFGKCAEKKATDKMMLEKLKTDVKVMRTMKKVTRTVKRTVVTSLLETGAHLQTTPSNDASRPGYSGVQKMIENAKAASLEVHNCLKHHAPASLLEKGNVSVSFDLDDLNDALRDDDDDEDEDDEVGEVQPAATPLVSAQPTQVAKTIPEIPAPQPSVALPVAQVHQVPPTPPVAPPASQTRPAPTLASEPEHCKVEREQLEETWIVAYEEITREVESYQILVDDTSCVDAAEAEYEEKFQPLQQREKELSHKVSIAISKVQNLRPQLQTLRKARKELKKRLEVITQECEAVDKTKETLEVTKEVIIKMDECAGLDGSAFKLPVWVGQWIAVDLGEDVSIADSDAKMNQACAQTFGGAAKAAQVSEVDTGSIRRMPKRNEASLPLMPACPMCGTQHARVCWESGAKLNHRKRRTDCTSGARAVMCVTSDDSQAQ